MKNKRKKIAIISPGGLPLPATKGGAVENLINTLIDYNEDTNLYDLNIFSIYDKESKKISSRYDNSIFTYIKINKILLSFAMKKVIPLRWYYRIYCHLCINKLIKYNADVIVIQNEFIYANIIKRRIKNKPLILHLHNDYINETSKINTTDNIDGIICVSDYIKNRIRGFDNLIQVNTVHNGIDLNLFTPSKDRRTTIREKYGLDSEDIVIIYAGRLIKEKGVFELISAVNLINKKNVKLLVCGSSGFKNSAETPYIKMLKEKAQESDGKIIFTGYVDYNELNQLYQSADIGCIPSIFEEPFGLTVIEQMASGLPVVVSDAGAICEIVSEDSAIVVKRDKDYIYNIKVAIEELCDDDRQRKKMGIKARKQAEKFSHNRYCEGFFKALNIIINTNN